MSFLSSVVSDRPTLPPLHTLDLPRGSRLLHDNEFNDKYKYERQTPSSSFSVFNPSKRQYSTSSSATSLSRTPSPSPSSSSSNSNPSPPAEPNIHVRLVPSTLQTADALVVIAPPPQDAPSPSSLVVFSPSRITNTLSSSSSPPSPPPRFSSISAISSLSNNTLFPDESERARALLVFGPALQQFRHPRRQIAKGARVHPYRIVRTCRGRKTDNMVGICV